MLLKVIYAGCVALALTTLVWAAPRGVGVSNPDPEPAKRRGPSVRGGGTYVFVGGFGGK